MVCNFKKGDRIRPKKNYHETFDPAIYSNKVYVVESAGKNGYWVVLKELPLYVYPPHWFEPVSSYRNLPKVSP